MSSGSAGTKEVVPVCVVRVGCCGRHLGELLLLSVSTRSFPWASVKTEGEEAPREEAWEAYES